MCVLLVLDCKARDLVRAGLCEVYGEEWEVIFLKFGVT